MSTIAEKLTQLNTIKQNQKTYLGTSENDFSKYLGLFKDKIEEVLINAQQLYFKNPNSTDATFKLNDKSSNQSVQYSLDYGKTWTELANQTLITIPGNGICMLRGKLSGNNSNENYTKFYIREYDLECHGNIMNLYNYENPYNTTLTYTYAFRRLFENCYTLLTAPTLPATTLAAACYFGMFNGCTSLTTAPELPATTLVQNCYRGMFQQCTSLTSAPELKATTLADYCCRSMFYLCSSLNYVKCLATNISATECTLYWLDGVAESGTFVKASSMSSWTTGANGIPANWTVQNA